MSAGATSNGFKLIMKLAAVVAYYIVLYETVLGVWINDCLQCSLRPSDRLELLSIIYPLFHILFLIPSNDYHDSNTHYHG